MELSDFDRNLLRELKAVTLEDDVFEVMSENIGVAPEVIINRLTELKDNNLLRRWGVVLDSRTLGYHSALLAAKTSPEELVALETWALRQEGVTHCYTRRLWDSDWNESSEPLADFNVWLTLIARSKTAFDSQLAALQEEVGLDADSLLVLPSQKKFKLRFDNVFK